MPNWKSARLNRLYATLSQINQAIVRAGPLMNCFRRFARLRWNSANSDGWIGRLDAATGALVPIAKAAMTRSRTGEPSATVAVRWRRFSRGNHVYQPPFVRAAHGCLPGASRKGGVAGLCCVSYPAAKRGLRRIRRRDCRGRFFNDAETRLLDEVALDISFALDSLELERLRREAETALEGRERQVRAILETAQDGFVLVDTQGKLLEVNEAYCSMSGYSRDELLQMRIPDVECSETEQEIANRIQQIMRHGSDCFETRHRRKDGQVIDVGVSMTFQHFDGGRLVLFPTGYHCAQGGGRGTPAPDDALEPVKPSRRSADGN